MKKQNSLLMSKPLSLLAVGIAGTLVVIGCGKDSNNGNGPLAPVEQKTKALEIAKKWTSACENISLDIFGFGSQKEQFDFGTGVGGTPQTKTTIYYRENNCATPTVRVAEIGNYALGDKVANLDAYNLDEHYQSVSITPMSDDGKNSLNLVQACGINDWAVGIERDVTAKSSATPLIDRCWSKTPRDAYDIAQITADTLRFGLVKDGKDRTGNDKRPSEIDQGQVFTKQ